MSLKLRNNHSVYIISFFHPVYRCCHIAVYILVNIINVVILLVLICLEKSCVVVVGSPSSHLVNDCVKGPWDLTKGLAV